MAKARDIPGLTADLPFAQAAARTVTVRSEELFDAREGVLDTGDIERVHDMRVASRRLRAALEMYAVCFPKQRHKEALRDVKKIADALGARRDPDVQLEALEEMQLQPTPGLHAFVAELHAEQVEGNVVLEAALREVEESNLRGRLIALAEEAAA